MSQKWLILVQYTIQWLILVTLAPKDRSTLENENSKFCNIDRISNFEDLNKSLCPTGYQLKKDENEAIFYRIEPHSVLSIPQVSETIVVDKMLHVKPF